MNIKKLIFDGEGVQLDFKKTISNTEKIAKTLVAFANNQGGRLLIGVADDGSIRGVKSEEEEKYMINKAAHQYCKPALEPYFTEILVDDKLVLVVEINESETKPHYALDENGNWWVYLRSKDKSVLASKLMVEVLKAQSSNSVNLIRYSNDEKKLLEYLDQNGQITIKQLIKLLRCSQRKAQKILINLILTGIIEPILSEKEECYQIRKSEV